MQRISSSLAESGYWRPDYPELMKSCLGDDLVRRTKGLDGGALAVLVWAPPMVKSDSIPATATITAPRGGIQIELMGDPLGRVHHGGARTLGRSSRWFATQAAR